MDNTINLENMTEIGQNVKAVKSGNQIILVINADERHGLSASGKTTIVASTRGNVQFGGLTIGLNIYTKQR